MLILVCMSLTDRVLIDKLIEASQAGVTVELWVRGICCLVSGIPGYTDHIRVQSLVGRYLEHSRIYIFGTEETSQRIYISSADFMTRNTIHRVEVAVPIYDPAIRQRILWIFRTGMADNVKARVQRSDGSYKKKKVAEGEPLLNAQEFFFEDAYQALERAKAKQAEPAPVVEEPESVETVTVLEKKEEAVEETTVSVSEEPPVPKEIPEETEKSQTPIEALPAEEPAPKTQESQPPEPVAEQPRQRGGRRRAAAPVSRPKNPISVLFGAFLNRNKK